MNDAADGARQRGILADDAGRLAAELQRHRRQILGGGLHDEAADRRRAGIEKMIERQSRERLADIGPADDRRDLLGRKQAGEKFGQKFRRARRQLRGFQHHPVAGGERRDERHDGEIEGIIPRADDADDADRLIEDAGAGRA